VPGDTGVERTQSGGGGSISNAVTFGFVACTHGFAASHPYRTARLNAADNSR